MTIVEPAPANPRNAWRLETPGVAGWPRTARPHDPNKYFMVSADCHFTEGLGFIKGIEAEYADRTPRVEVRDDDSQWMITEGNAPMMVKPGRKSKTVQDQQSSIEF